MTTPGYSSAAAHGDGWATAIERGAYYAATTLQSEDPEVVADCFDAAFWGVFFMLETRAGMSTEEVKREFKRGWIAGMRERCPESDSTN